MVGIDRKTGSTFLIILSQASAFSIRPFRSLLNRDFGRISRLHCLTLCAAATSNDSNEISEEDDGENNGNNGLLRGMTGRFEVSEEEHGMRLDSFLSLKAPMHSRSYLASLCYSSQVVRCSNKLEKVLQKKSIKVNRGETIKVTFTETGEFKSIEPEDIPLCILFENDDLVAVAKPVGMVVHPALGNWNGTLVNALAFHFEKTRSNITPQPAPTKIPASLSTAQLPPPPPSTPSSSSSGTSLQMRPGIVHRLDKGTSGVIMVAKTPEALAFYSDAFKSRTVRKTYLAIGVGLPVPGAPTAGASYGGGSDNDKDGGSSDKPTKGSSSVGHGSSGSGRSSSSSDGVANHMGGGGRGSWAEVVVREPIGRHPVHRQRMGVVPTGKPALSRVTPIAFDGKLSLSKVAIETGRTHQIRVHMAHLRHPIIGDDVYGYKDWNARYARTGADRAAEAGSFAFTLPNTSPSSTLKPHRRVRVARPMLHAAELVLPVFNPPTSSTSTSPVVPAAAAAAAAQELVIRCPLPEDFASLAQSITGKPFDLDAALDSL